ncbi:MAG: glycoside hydrolase family 3 C-terminal domain-containing protein [Acidobacteriota bacterium]|nr:MAG: glycoside hydrolase family 3 C-terminal domain-containing protein [Acidobacteriota bacterium]
MIAPRVRGGQPLTAWDSEVSELLAQMTLAEKIGQMTQAERRAISDVSDISTYHLGSILSGGGSTPEVNRVDHWADMVDQFQSEALKSRLGIPILYGVDAVHGHSNVFGAVIFPHNIGLGATRNSDLVERVARVTASEVRATGINWTFGPCVTVPQDERWGRTYEGFSEDPSLVQELSRASVLGFQTTDLSDPLGIVACAKHYMGDGGTQFGIDQGDTRVDEETLRRIHLPGYLGALEAGVGTIMVSYSSWNGQKLSSQKYLLTDLLKEELGFEGFLVSDWAAIDQLPGTYRDQVRESINAGLDMIMVPYRYQEFITTLTGLVASGEVPESRIDDAVRRILRVKFAAGLFSRSPWTDRTLQNRFGSAGHRELAREAVRQSQVMLKNTDGLLPLSPDTARILVAGKNAHNLGNQCGGWTITWQGGSGPITTGTTILEGIQQTVSSATVVTYSRWGTGAAMADIAIAVIGETPYAEGYGDRQSLLLDDDDRAVISRIAATATPLVVVIVSGRPMILGEVEAEADAIIASWLPGTEGRGVADVLFGVFAPVGKLPCSWPSSMSQIPINLGDEDYTPLYPYDYGLSY